MIPAISQSHNCPREVPSRPLLDELRRVGVEVLFVNQPIAPDGLRGQLFLGMQGLFEYERARWWAMGIASGRGRDCPFHLPMVY